MLKLSKVSKHFGGLHVLQNVSIEVPEGGIFGLIGPNGAGKTTLFNLVTGLVAPSSGTLQFGDESLAGLQPHDISARGIARTFQNIRIFKEMTLLENVVVGMHRHLDYGPADLLMNLPRYRQHEQRSRERALELLSWVKLEHRADDVADNLPYGDQRKLELARALASKPKLLLLDEPVAGMNHGEKDDLMTEIESIKARGFTIFVIEHDMGFVMSLCERIAVLNFGCIIAEGSPNEIKKNPQVIEAYLGRDEEPVGAEVMA
jgi:branched-chain amino acid transport system ATP-binding protein